MTTFVARDPCELPALISQDQVAAVGETFTCSHGVTWVVQWQQPYGGQPQPVWVTYTPPPAPTT